MVTLIGKEKQSYVWDGIKLIPDGRAEVGEGEEGGGQGGGGVPNAEMIWGSWDGGIIRIKKGDSNLLHFIYLPGTCTHT